MRQKNHAMAFRLSLSSLMAALGTVLMLSSNLIPVLTYVAPMLTSLTLIPILSEFGKKYAWMTWGVTALLALLLCADREAAGLEDMKSEMLLSIVVYAMLVGTMLLFDRVYERMRLLYERRLRNKLIRKPPTG